MVFLLVLLSMICTVCFIPFQVTSIYTIRNTKDHHILKISAWGKFTIFRTENAYLGNLAEILRKRAKKRARKKRKQRKKKIKARHIARASTELLSLCQLSRLKIQIRIGAFSDAALTALCCGGIRAALLPLLYNLLPPKHHSLLEQLSILPDFERECLEVRIECILTLKLVHIIRVAFKTQKMIAKER